MVLLPTTALIICLSPMAFAQADTCSKPRVAVQLTQIHDEVIELLNSKGVPQPRESWILQIQGKVLEELRMASPGTVFVQVDGVGGALPKDCDYGFQYLIHFIAAGEEIEVWGGLLQSEYTAYYMSSKLAQNNPCEGPDTVDVEITKKDEDVFLTIEHNIETWGDIGKRIDEFERAHPVPPRGPELEISQDPEFVSPLQDERELNIKLNVTDCRGEVVYEKFHGQKTTLPRRTDRGELSETNGFPQRVRVAGDMLYLYVTQPGGASATYALKKGVEPHVESIEITTCGIDTKIIKKETQIHIRGLKLRVSPEKRTISPGEKTRIEIELSKVDDKGHKEPLPGKQIEIDIRGLVDGDVRPSGDITTDDDGVAILEFSAGDNDGRVTFGAKFQPKKYDDFVHDEDTVSVGQPSDVTATLEARFRQNYHLRKEDQDQVSDVRLRLTFDVTVQATFKYHKTHSGDNSSQYAQRYKLTSWEITRSTATLNEKAVTTSKDKTSTLLTEATGKAEKGDHSGTLSILFDARTKKALEVDFPILSVNIDGEGKITDNGSVSESPWRYYFRPIWGSFEEFIKVNSGDGKTNIGGKGLHVFETPLEDRQTLSVDWNIQLN